MAFAHSLKGQPSSEWHVLEDHLQSVGGMAGDFAESWGARDIAYLAGLWHDLGKYAPDWQEFLASAGSEAPVLGDEQASLPAGRKRGPDHSTAGAIHASRRLGAKSLRGLALRFVIAAHHAGLADQEDLRDRVSNPGKERRYESAATQAPLSILEPNTAPSLPGFLNEPGTDDQKLRRFETFIRMLFSAMVDADHLDTEAFMSPDQAAERPRWRSIEEYEVALDAKLNAFEAPSTAVNVQRARVLDWCRAAAFARPGSFSLTVPTGGGKTLSSLAFALRHARANGLERVIVALPFLSILDQTADVFRKVFAAALGGSVLIEHHSSVLPGFDTMANRLASENWDAPLIVTTQVQLFDSLFSKRPRSCRKLHRLAKSVIVLDEVQTLPAELLAPILDQLQELVSNYGSTLLLTTATQPALHARALGPKPFPGLRPKPVEIVPDAELPVLFAAFRRVRVHWPGSDPVEWPALAERIAQHPSALAIVHRRADAIDLWREIERLEPDSTKHLSALMCPAHRRVVLAEVRQALTDGRPCRVVSTQLVEAGVDLDFPVVFRAMGGLESMAQAAGRCNREGKLSEPGDFFVFRAKTRPPGLLADHADVAISMLAFDPELDLMAPATFRQYFDQLYAFHSLDKHGIQALRRDLRFGKVAEKFRMIDDTGTTIFVPYGKAGRRAIERLRFAGPSQSVFRELQSFGVSVYPKALGELRGQGVVEQLHDTAWTLISEVSYDHHLGIKINPEPFEGFIV